MNLLVDGQPLQAGRPTGDSQAVLRLLAGLTRVRPGWRIEVAVNTALPPLDWPADGPPSVVPFTPPAGLAGRPASLDLYYGDWLLARRPAAVLLPGLPPRGAAVPQFVGHFPRLLALVDPADWEAAVVALAADPASPPVSAEALNLLLRAEHWFGFRAGAVVAGTPPFTLLPHADPELFATAVGDGLRGPAPARPGRIAWVVPPAAGSAVAGWAGDLAAALRSAYHVDLVAPPPGDDGERPALLPEELVTAQRFRPHDLVVYHLGNHPQFAFMLPLIRAVPGLVVVHDSDLADLAAAAFGRTVADPAAELAADVFAPDSVLACCSAAAARRFGGAAGITAVVLPRGVPAVPDRPVIHARLRLNLPLGLYLVGVWADAGNAAPLGTLLEAVAGLPRAVWDRIRVVIAGSPSAAERGELERRAGDLGLANHLIWRTGEAAGDDAVFARAIDVCVALGGARDGEQTLRVLAGLAAGTVVLAAADALPGIPADRVTVRVDPGDLVGGLRHALADLYHAPPLRQKLAAAGREFAAAAAPFAAAADHLHAVIEQTIRDRTAADADWKSAARRAVGAGGLPPGFAAEWAALRLRAAADTADTRVVRYAEPAPSPAAAVPAVPRSATAGRRLWVNMSHVLDGHRGHYTGISRMVVSVVRELVAHRLADVRYCRVRGDGPAAHLAAVAPAAVAAHIAADVTGPAPDLDRHTGDGPADFRPGDVLFCPEVSLRPDYLAYLRRLRRERPIAVVPVVCDVIAARCPHYFGADGLPHLWDWAATAVATADLVLAISRHTADDVRWFAGANGLAVPPVEVIRLGDEDLSRIDTRGRAGVAGLTAGDRFALVCCTLEPRKNHQLLWDVWRRLLAARGPDRTPRLVCAGRVGWAMRDALDQLRADPLLRDHVVLLDDVDDAGLAWLYRHCLFALYPSHYEGWGLPVGEALAAGKFAVVSNSSSLPEVGGDLVDYHDPDDVPGCHALVERAAFDDAYRAGREARVRAEYRPTSWLACARQIVDRIERHLGPLAPATHRAAA